MVKCKDCGLKGSIDDREKFMQHGYPKDGYIRLSCINCGSINLKNTFWENFFFYLQWSIVFIIAFPIWIWITLESRKWRKVNNDSQTNL